MKTKQIITTAILASATILSSCEKNNIDPKKPQNNNAQELITSVVILGYNESNPSLNQFSFKWEDLDGDGGNAPTIDTILLDTGITYRVNILLLDKTKTPFDTISNEVIEEANEHQLFYTLNAVLTDKLSIEKLDFDTHNPALPLGLQVRVKPINTVQFTTPIIGSLNIVLSHYDGVPKTTIPSTESDIDITFPVKLK